MPPLQPVLNMISNYTIEQLLALWKLIDAKIKEKEAEAAVQAAEEAFPEV